MTATLNNIWTWLNNLDMPSAIILGIGVGTIIGTLICIIGSFVT